MSKLVTVRINHSLGKEEAIRRLQAGVGQARGTFGSQISSFDETWRENELKFRLGAMGQVVSGDVTVEDDHVMANFELPTLLAFFANKAKALVQKQGVLMLDKK